MKKNVALVLLGLVIGCGAGAAVTQQAGAQGYPMGPAVPAPAAPAGARWQQFCEQASSVQEASSMASARGVEGFELVAMYNGVVCFKRPILAGVGGLGGSAPAPAPSVPSGFPGY
jgi:hypothetical protein